MALDCFAYQGLVDLAFEPDFPDDEHAVVDFRVDAAGERVAMEQRADVPAPLPLVRRFVDLPDVLESKCGLHELAIPHERIERPEDPDAAVVADFARCQKLWSCEIATRRSLDRHLDELAAGDHFVRHRREPDFPEHRPVRAARPGEEPRRKRSLSKRPSPEVRRDFRRRRWPQRTLWDVVDLRARVSASRDHDVASRPEHLQRHRRRLRRAFPPTPVERGHAAVVGQLARAERASLADLCEHGIDELLLEPLLALAVTPPLGTGCVPAVAVPRERRCGQDAALLREVLERVTGEDVRPELTSPHAVDACHDDEVGIRADDVEGIDLDAAEPFEHRAHPAPARAEARCQAKVRDEKAAGFGGSEGDGRIGAQSGAFRCGRNAARDATISRRWSEG